MKIAVLGNCQAQGIARVIEALLPVAEVTAYQVSTVFKGTHPVGSPEDCYHSVIQSDLALVINSDWLEKDHIFRKDILKANCKNLILYPGIAFSGYHPDCGYLPKAMASKGPMGPYHSTIAAVSYRMNMSPARATLLYNKYIYARLGFMQDYLASSLLLKRQSEEVGFNLEGIFDTNRSNMHTINHPHIDVLKLIGRQALKKAGFELDSEDDPEVEDTLYNYRWPVYPGLFPEIPGSLVFCRGRGTKMEHTDFIKQEFDTFDTIGGPDMVTSPAIERALSALRPVLIN